MTETIKVAHPGGDEAPRAEDARRVGTLRRITAARLRHCGLQALIEDVGTIVSELLTNALLHSGATKITLHLGVRDGFLRVAVIDGMSGHATLKHADDDNTSRRGLAFVEALAKEHHGTWGTSDDGTLTWCNLAVPTEERS
ncbi:conserved hypothetical protein [Streptomyces viridochromogenes DSM 40736]|uniref:Histidine kinase/HSP90-like ATPase domain-containing protein n=1 Tax=Streptomyces viridochromogenes (strain DSM 40736 / JCM 4977 / BCRC 1201 / Tue 494) TaxID=591159 RepID=D9X1U1_STRVT|nr:ATP-binding protein [Streptomyces viridochromogenes]EFL29513.1 conserved hypothetical protein [Streptomyces viridochromogenes DSM 40736]